MKLSYRGVSYESDTSRRLLERETTAKYRGVDYVIQHFGEKLPAPEPNLKYRGTNYRQCLSATQVQSRNSPLANFAESDFFSEFIE
ncbi:DUF4278 domain-containing protein [Nostoc sp.]|uniref:DUF4278 domain-containing protein n=1 Tax=Nostoc sp. TaxID=1180 RepID=UPI003592F40B